MSNKLCGDPDYLSADQLDEENQKNMQNNQMQNMQGNSMGMQPQGGMSGFQNQMNQPMGMGMNQPMGMGNRNQWN